MTNSLLLRIAAGLCALNLVFAAWSTWSMNRTRARLEDGFQQAERSRADIVAKTDQEAAARQEAVSQAMKRIEAAERAIEALRASMPDKTEKGDPERPKK